MWGWTGLAAACMAIRDRKPYVRGDGLMVDDKTTFEQAVNPAHVGMDRSVPVTCHSILSKPHARRDGLLKGLKIWSPKL